MSPALPARVRAAVAEALGPGVVEIVTEPHAYATTHRLVELHVHRRHGATVELLCKEQSAPAGRRGTRPAFLVDPDREARVYRSLLQGRGLGSPRCIASGRDPVSGSSWLVLERLPGVPLWQLGELDAWCDVAAWTARLHTALAGASEAGGAGLVVYDRTFFARWPSRARALTPAGTEAAERLARVLEGYDDVLDALAGLPPIVVHGELYASNVMVDVATERIGAVDWEVAGLGTGLLDLACLVAGGWDDEARGALVGAYHEALPAAGRAPLRALERDLRLVELHLCIQWLGWSHGWRAPVEHAQDWLARAEGAKARLGLGG